MIRINLIQAPAREAEAKSVDRGRLRDRAEIYPLAALVVCFGLAGLAYLRSNREIATLNRQMIAERKEASRLSGIEAQNKQYQLQLAEIDQHINVIQTLEKQRTGPRDLMTLLGNAAGQTPGVYFLSVDSDQGRLNVHGQSDDAMGIANFIAALENAGTFSDVELRRVFEDDRSTRVSFKFDLDCLYKPPVEMAASTLPAPPSGGFGRPPGR